MLYLDPPWPNFSEEEGDAVRRVLLSNRVNYWTGEECRIFEREFAEFAGTKFAISLTNGTVALDLALHGLGVGSNNGGSADDEVIVTPRSFIASVSSVINAGARPVFADVGADSQNIEGDSVGAVLTPRTRAVICVHLAGWPCDMDAIRAAAGPKVFLIEDCAQAHGALYKGKPVGSLGDVAAWSFCQDKIMTTGGEGGMVTTDDEDLWRRMWAFKDHGKSFAAVYEKQHPPGFRWVHDSIGTNWRMIEMQAVIGRIQLRRMAEWNRQRAQNAVSIQALLEPYAGPDGFIRIPALETAERGSLADNQRTRHAWYRFYAFVRPERLPANWTRDIVLEKLAAEELSCMQGSCSEIYREKAFDGSGFRPSTPLPKAKTLGETSMMFFTHPGMRYPYNITLGINV